MNPYAVGQLWSKGSVCGLYLLLAPLGRGEDVDKDIWWFKWRVVILYPNGEIKISEPFLHKDPQEGDVWCMFERAYFPRSYGQHDVYTQKTFFLIKKTFNAKISHGWKCYVTSSHENPKIEVVDVRAVESWFSSDKYLQNQATADR